MKNYIFAALFCFGGSILFASCEKCITCEYSGSSIIAGTSQEFCSKDKDERDAFESVHKAAGATCTED